MRKGSKSNRHRLQSTAIIASRAATLKATFNVAGGSAGSILTFGEITRVENSGGIQASLSGRYATALFELARDAKAIDSVGKSLDSLQAALSQSADFVALTTNPLLSRDAAAATVARRRR